MSNSSKYFESLLGPNFKEGTEKEVVLKKIDGSTLKTIIYYIYAGHVKLTEDNIVNVLAAASGMELVSLEEKCSEYLQENLTKENCLDVLSLADKYGIGQLRTNALNLVCAHFENIPLADILQLDGIVFNDLLKCEHFEANETKIFESLAEWVQQNESKRAKFMPELLQSIRLEYLPGEVIPQINYLVIFQMHSKLVFI